MLINIDLRKELDNILSNFGYYVILQRTSRKIRCFCYDEKLQEAKSNCLACGGTGWIGRLEKHVTRKDEASDIITYPDKIKQTDIGKMASPSDVFYFKHYVHPQVGDYIFEVGWTNNKPTNLLTVYRINHVQPVRGTGGRIEYYWAACKREPINLEFFQLLINRSVIYDGEHNLRPR